MEMKPPLRHPYFAEAVCSLVHLILTFHEIKTLSIDLFLFTTFLDKKSNL